MNLACRIVEEAMTNIKMINVSNTKKSKALLEGLVAITSAYTASKLKSTIVRADAKPLTKNQAKI